MKRVNVLVLLVVLLSGTTNAQIIDSNYRTSYYEQKVSMFRLLPDTKDEIIFLGNSITDIAEWTEIWQNPKVKNRGISTDNSFGVLARLDEVLASKPAKIFLMIGINDIAKNVPDSIIIANIIKIAERVRRSSPATQLIIQSILPTNPVFTEFPRYQHKDIHIRFVNQALQEYCTKKKLIFVDLYSHFKDANGHLSANYTNDGVHINGAGYFLWRSVLKKMKLL
ncbi:MAG: sialate O-acetylesterase [Chitinophagaceae bacterium]|nr:sialate O-acetylesterase [Chitinophagaceae bacterium]